jgi:glutathione S-transferase
MAAAQIEIIGSPISPYVRKVLAACAFKNIEVTIDPVVPFFGDDRFTELSPLRRIPVFRDEQVSLCDSSVICQYLEDRWPTPPLYPQEIQRRARARWLEEYADTRIGDVFIWRLFNNAVIGPAVFGSGRDKELQQETISKEVPAVLDYLEASVPDDGYLCGDLGIADLAVAPFFDNLDWARVELDWRRWPGTAAWLTQTRETSALGALASLGAALVRTPIPEHGAKLTALGVAVSADTMATDTPRRGPMTVQSLQPGDGK